MKRKRRPVPPRSAEQIVTILGILKAGAGYIPLDPCNPAERNRFVLRDSNPLVVVTTRAMRLRLPASIIAIFEIDDVERNLTSSMTVVEPCATPRSLAYVMYTSGSTGQPKGVMVEHRSVLRLVIGQRYATFDPSRVFLQLAPRPLMRRHLRSGGRCCMVGPW